MIRLERADGTQFWDEIVGRIASEPENVPDEMFPLADGTPVDVSFERALELFTWCQGVPSWRENDRPVRRLVLPQDRVSEDSIFLTATREELAAAVRYHLSPDARAEVTCMLAAARDRGMREFREQASKLLADHEAAALAGLRQHAVGALCALRYLVQEKISEWGAR